MAERQQLTFTPDETIALLNSRVKEEPGLTLRVKVFKRQRVTGLLEHVATLSGATIVNVANPEQWIPELCGGGSFVLSVFSIEAPTVAIGGHLPYSHKALERDVDVKAVSKPTWEGPPVLEFPKPIESTIPEAFSTSVIPQFAGGSGTQMPLTQAPPSFVPGQAGSGPSFNTNHDAVWLKQMEDRFAAREREMLAAEAKMRAEADAQKMALREERLRNEFEAKQRELEGQIKLAAQAAQAAPKANGFAEILAVIAPVIGQVLKSQDETRLQMLKAQQEAAAQQQLLLAKLLDKPAMGPEMQMVLELVKSKGGENKEMLEAMGVINKSALSMLHTVADLNLGGQQEHPLMAAVKEGIKALRIAQSGAAKPTPQPIAYPPPQPMPQFEQQARAIPAGAQAQGPQSFAGLPAQQPVVAAPKPVAQAPQAPAVQPAPSPAEMTLIQRLVVMIKTYQPPVEVAKMFLLNLRDPSILEAMQASGMDTDALVANLLGDWMTASQANMAYLEALRNEVDRLGVEAGLFDEEEAEPPQNGAIAPEVAADALEEEGEEDAEYEED